LSENRINAPDLPRLAATLADWSTGTTFIIYLFGSRVRGDHRPDSDVDVVIPIPNLPTDFDMEWWARNNRDLFAAIDARLPGKLHILEKDEPLVTKILEAARNPTYRDRNVISVWLPPKTLSPR